MINRFIAFWVGRSVRSALVFPFRIIELRAVYGPNNQEVSTPKARSFRSIAFAALLLLLSFAVQPAHSQVLYGSLVGNVTDASKAGVAGATVRITQVETNESRQAQTNDTGIYSFPVFPPERIQSTYKRAASTRG